MDRRGFFGRLAGGVATLCGTVSARPAPPTPAEPTGGYILPHGHADEFRRMMERGFAVGPPIKLQLKRLVCRVPCPPELVADGFLDAPPMPMRDDV